MLKDIIDSKMFPTVMLTKIFRQASTSDIIVNAHKINQGEKVSLDNKSMDFFFLKRYEADKIINVTLQLIKQKLPKFVGASEYDIQVLTPMRKGRRHATGQPPREHDGRGSDAGASGGHSRTGGIGGRSFRGNCRVNEA